MGQSDVPRRRGEPLVALSAIALAWVTVRAFAWQSPFPLEGLQQAVAVSAELVPLTPRAYQTSSSTVPEPGDIVAPRSARRIVLGTKVRAEIRLVDMTPAPSVAAPRHGELNFLLQSEPIKVAPQASAPAPVPGGSSSPLRSMGRKWHVDSWVTWRSGDEPPSQGVQLPLAYGASQAGILARYDLGAGKIRPQAYIRGVYAPERPSQSDVAVGLGARPLARIPIRLQAEVRATKSSDATVLRPVALAVTELAPLELPLGLRAEGYAQGGWAGGRYATGFIDGQARVDRQVVGMGPARLRLGAGVWGGAQKSVGRLDVGPTLTIDLRETPVPARISVDYRHQALGNARPGSGMAVSLSTGF